MQHFDMLKFILSISPIDPNDGKADKHYLDALLDAESLDEGFRRVRVFLAHHQNLIIRSTDYTTEKAIDRLGVLIRTTLHACDENMQVLLLDMLLEPFFNAKCEDRYSYVGRPTVTVLLGILKASFREGGIPIRSNSPYILALTDRIGKLLQTQIRTHLQNPTPSAEELGRSFYNQDRSPLRTAIGNFVYASGETSEERIGKINGILQVFQAEFRQQQEVLVAKTHTDDSPLVTDLGSFFVRELLDRQLAMTPTDKAVNLWLNYAYSDQRE